MEFALHFDVPSPKRIRIHASADQQYLLWLDGKVLGRGCEMKSPENWFFETYDLDLTSGPHCLDALVWNYGDLSPVNRMSISPGFFLLPDAPNTELLGTGLAPWKVRINDGVDFQAMPRNLGVYISVPPHEMRDCSKFHRENCTADWEDALAVAPGINGALKMDATMRCLVI